MHVPSYQMHNVLNVYSKQLKQNLASAGKTGKSAVPIEDRVNLSPEVKRQATIEKVSKDILDKISSYGSHHYVRQPISEQADIQLEQAALAAKTEDRKFVFHAIDAINNKSKNTLSVDDSIAF